MALDVDGFAILRTIGVHPHIFKAVVADTAKAARTLVAKQIAHKNTSLKAVRDIRAAVGPDAFSLIMDGISDLKIRSLVIRLDRHSAQAKATDGSARLHFLALANGSAQPAEQPAAAPRTVRPKKAASQPKPPGRINYVSAGATRKR